jgi:hypothetical protein
MADANESWAIKWLMSRRPSDEQTAVLTAATEALDDIQDKHDERRKEIDAQLERRRDQISNNVYAGAKDATERETLRNADIKSAEDAHAKALARLDKRTDAVQDVQRIIVRR